MPSLLLLLLPGVSSLLCGLVINGTSRTFEFDFFDNTTGVLQTWMGLPDLENAGFGPSTGAQYGMYYTISNEVALESSYFVAQLRGNSSKWVHLKIPKQFANLTRYGLASLNLDPVSKRALGFIVGIDADTQWYGFLGFLNDTTGQVELLADLSDAYRSWEYVYDGISAWDPTTRMYYISAVSGEHATTTIFGFNTSLPGPQVPVYAVPWSYDDEGAGMYQSLAIVPEVAAKHPGSTNLVALVDDLSNTAAAIWLLGDPKQFMWKGQAQIPRTKPCVRIPRGSRAPVRVPAGTDLSEKPTRLKDAPEPWIELIQFPPMTLSMDGYNNMEVDGKGSAYAVFYDQHRPVANQVVVQVNLLTALEVKRTILKASYPGTQIWNIATCPM